MSQDPTPLLFTIVADRNRQYWFFQLTGWGALAVFSILSLNIWYTPGQLAPVVHSVLQSIVGIIISHPLRYVAQKSWDDELPPRILKNVLAVLFAAFLWTIWRVTSFTWLTGEVIERTDWGGWINLSVIVFVGWTICYHALKYYQQSIAQRQLTIAAQNKALAADATAQKENLKRLEAEKQFKESQLRMLKYQLNPHFFLNALNSVSALVRRNQSSDAIEMLARIGDFLRLSLDDSDELSHSVEEEWDAIQSYLDIEKIRFGDRLHTVSTIAPEARSFKIPTLLLQPVFENAIKHAVSKRQSPTTIRFEATKTDSGIRFFIHDDGPGASVSKDQIDEVTSGIGLANVRNRLESTFGSTYRMDICRDKTSGYSVEIQIDEE